MKISSKTGYRGVEPFRGQYRAVYRKGLEQKTIGVFSTPEEAARAFDAYSVQRKGIGLAFPQLNLPTEEHKQAYEQYQAKSAALAETTEAARIAQLKSTPIPAEKYGSLIALAHGGEPIDQLALIFGTHEDVVRETLRSLEKTRLSSLGVTVESNPAVSRETIREHVTLSQRAGESIRSIADRLGIDRKTVTKWLAGE